MRVASSSLFVTDTISILRAIGFQELIILVLGMMISA